MEKAEPETGDKSSRTPVEELSREDLIKQVKRQLLFLQKSKHKYDEVNAKNRALEEKNKDLEKRLEDSEVTERERNELREAYLSLQLAQEKQFSTFQDLEQQLAEAREGQTSWRRKYQECMDQLECMESKMSSFSQGTACLQEELKRLESANKELNNDISTLKEEKQVAVNELHNLRLELESLRQEQSSHESLSSQCLAEDIRNENLQEQLQELKSECSMLREKIQTAISENECLQQHLEAADEEKLHLGRQLTEALNEKAVLENQRDIKVNECNLLQEEKHGLEHQVSELYQVKENLELKDKELAKLRDENSRLEGQLTEASAEKDEYQQIANDVNEKLDQQHEKENQFQKSLNSLKEEKETAEREVHQQADELSSLKDKNAELERSLEKLSRELAFVEELRKEAHRSTIFSEENVRLESELFKALGERDSLHKKVESFLEEKALYDKIDQEKQQEIDSLKSNLDERKEENQRLNNELEKLQSIVNNLRRETEVNVGESHQTKADGSSLVEKLKELVSTVNVLQDKLGEALNQKQDILEELQQVKDLQRFVEDEARELREESEKLKTEVKSLDADLENDRLHIQKLEEELEEAENRDHASLRELESLRDQVEELAIASLDVNKALKGCKNLSNAEIFSVLCEKHKKITELALKAAQFEGDLLESHLLETIPEEQSNVSGIVSTCEAPEQDSSSKYSHEEVISLKEEYSSLNNQLALCESKMEAILSEKAAVERELHSEKSLKDGINKELVHKIKEIEHLEGEISKLENKIVEAEKEILNQTTQVTLKDGALKSLCEEYEEAKNKLLELTNENENLKSQLSDLSQENGILKDSVNNLKSRLDCSEDLAKEFDNTRSNYVALNAENARLASEAEELRMKLSDLNNALQESDSSKEMVLKENVKLKAEVEGYKTELCDYENLKYQTEYLNNENSKLKNDLQNMEIHFSSKNEMQSQLTEIRSTCENLAKENEELLRELENKSQCLSSQEQISTRNSEMEEQLQSLKSLLGLSVQEISHILAQTEISEIEGSNDLSDAWLQYQQFEDYVSIIETIKHLKLWTHSLFSHQSQLLNDYKKVKQELTEVKEELSERHSRVSELEANSAKLEEEVEAKNNLVEGIHCKMDDLLGQIETLNSQLHLKGEELTRSSQNVSSMEQKFNSKNEEIKILQERIDNLILDNEKLSKDSSHSNKCDSSVQTDIENILADDIWHHDLGALRQWATKELTCLVKKGLNLKDSSNGSSFTDAITASQTVSSDIKDRVNALEEGKNGCEYSQFEQNEISHLLVLVDLLTSLQKLLLELNDICVKSKIVKSESIESLNSSNGSVMEVPTVEESRLGASDAMEDATADELAALKNSIKERDEKLSKFKTLVLKVKKELVETKNKLSKATEENKQLEKKFEAVQQDLEKQSQSSCQTLKNFQSLQNEYDKLQDEFEAKKSLCKELEGKVTSVVNELAAIKLQVTHAQAERDKLKQLNEVVNAEKKAVEQSRNDVESRLHALGSELQGYKDKVEALLSQLKKSEENIENANKQLKAEKDQHKATSQELEKVIKESKMHSLLDLEMADYERTVTELNNLLEEKSQEIVKAREDASRLQDRIKSLTEHIGYLENKQKEDEERISGLKESISQVKQDLSIARAHEEELERSDVKLQSHLKAVQLNEEELKVSLADLTRKHQRLEETLHSSRETHQRATKTYESRINSLQEELNMTQAELESNRSEFDNYKVRVHSVLKQQQKKSLTEEVPERNVHEKLQCVVDHLRNKVEELSEQLDVCKTENETIQHEYERLISRHNVLTTEIEAREKEWRAKLEQATKLSTYEHQVELEKQLKSQRDELVSSFQQQLFSKEEHYQYLVKKLNEQLDSANKELEEIHQKTASNNNNSQMEENSLDILMQERQEGEGSECTVTSLTTASKSLPWNIIPSSGFTPLEQLLHGSSENLGSTNYLPPEDPDVLAMKLTEAHKKLDHMSELLNECEVSNLRMTEQIRVLKEEIRRMERNQEREKHAENLEYLKNVILKFSTLPGGSEKERLIPVLTTMLKLSPEEQSQLQAVVTGDNGSNAGAAGWGNYLHRWSGLV